MTESLTLCLLHACRAYQARVSERLTEALAAGGWEGIGPAQLAFLAELDCGRPTHASEVARRLGVSRQAVHRQVRELSGLGVVEVTEDPEKANRNAIAFTASGVELMAECRRVLAGMDAELAAALPQAERVAASLRKL